MEKFTTKTIRLLRALIVICTMTLFLNNGIFAQACTPPGATASVSGVLTCSDATVTLSGESSTTGVTYHWDGPDDFESGQQEQVISLPGKYVLTVTNPLDGCTSQDSVVVLKNITQPDAVATVSDTLNCLNSEVTLNASTNISSAEFHWIGPGSFNVYEQNTTTSVKGGYTLIVTDPDNGCASTATVYVDEDVQAPLVSAYVSGQLTCTDNQVELTSTSPTSRVLFLWSGSGISNPTQQNTSVSDPGICTITVTDTVNGCTSSASVEVIKNTEEPGALITSTTNEITCTKVNATLTANSSVPSVTYSWTGPGFSSTVQNPVVATPGEYILAVTRAGNGCVSKDTFNLGENKVRPGALASPSGQLTCIANSVTLQGSTSTSNTVTYRWIGANFSSNLQNPTTSADGPYMLIVTDANNGCTSSAFTTVQENKTLPASVTAGNAGPLTCADTSIALAGNSSTTGVTYSWVGPDFTSGEQNPVISDTGTYYLTVTIPENGCAVEKNTTVTENTTPPASVTADSTGNITCIIHEVNLSGNSTTGGVTYSWTGPGFSSTLKSPPTTTPGKYYLTVTDPDNGCYVIDSTVVVKDTISPADVAAGNNGPLTCAVLEANLSGSSSTASVIYNWTGPGSYTSTSQNPSVSTSGTYHLTVKNTVNGCTSSDSTVMVQDTIPPKDVLALNDGPLTCSDTLITLSASSSTDSVTFSWIGPDNYTSDQQNPEIKVSGLYSLTVEDTINKCKTTIITDVDADTIIPVAVNAVNDGPITCSDGNVLLTGSSLTSRVLYSWEGPENYTADTATPVVNQSGTYTLTVTDSVNGCYDVATTEVTQNVDLPTDVMASNNGPLTCSDTIITITASSSTGGVTYSWTGPGSFSSDTASPSISEDGEYYVTVTNPDNGCHATTSTIVDIDTVQPGAVLASNNGPLTCSDTTVTLTVSSSTNGVTYSWTGPGNFSSDIASPETDTLGTYLVTVTHPINKCTVSVSTVVNQNITPPGVTASAQGIFTCDNTSLILKAVSSADSVSYSWTGPGSFSSDEQNPEVFVSDTYTVIATDSVNGCTSESSVTTQADTASPGVTAEVFDDITCEVTSVVIQASSLTQDVEYKWTGPGNYTSTEQYPSTTIGGVYIATAKDPSNGCTSKDTITVVKDTLAPEDVMADVSDTITCTNGSVTLLGSSSTGDVNYSWEGPGFSSQSQSPDISNPGNYRLTVTNPDNKCYDTASVTVIENKVPPQEVSATASSMLNCTYPNVTLSAYTSTSDVRYKWSGPYFANDSIKQSVIITNAGSYTLTVTDTLNGCASTDIVSVTKNTTEPAGINTSVPGDLTCADTVIFLSASSSTTGVEYSWTGPGDFTSTDQNPGVTRKGDYTVTITNPDNGCDVDRILTVEQDTVHPAEVSASVTGDLTCSVNTVNLQSSTSTTGVTYQWSSPEGFTSDIAGPPVTEGGEYTLIVTDTTNGCTETRIVSVIKDTIAPANVIATVSSDINCYYPIVTLKGESTTDGVDYYWSGPFENSEIPFLIYDNEYVDSIMTAFYGKYTLKASNPVNGCSANDTITVVENRTTPDLSTTDATINCSETSVIISASSLTQGVTYIWSGDGITGDSSLQNQTVTVGGEYSVKATDPANGCFSSENVLVSVDTTSPDLTVDANGILTCASPTDTLEASSSTQNVTFTWEGFGNQNPIIVINPDDYTVTALNTSNGCTSYEVVTVTQDKAKPDLSTSVSDGGLLTCSTTSITLVGSTTTSDSTITWTGFTAGEDTVSVTNPGKYYVTVVANSNGCSRTDTISVIQNIAPPADVNITASSVINCNHPIVTLTGSTSTDSVSYLWSTGATDTTNSISTLLGGEYKLAITRFDNGCSDTAKYTLAEDRNTPDCNIITPSGSPVALQNDTITCQEVNDATYSWSITNANWTIVSGQGTTELVYTADSAGSNATINLLVQDTLNGCSSSCNIQLSAVATKSTPELTGLYNSNGMQIDVYPNPFSEETWIEFTSAKDEHITITIYNVNGQLLKTLFDSDVNHSELYKVAVDGSVLEQGSYYCIIKSNDKVYTRKLLLVR